MLLLPLLLFIQMCTFIHTYIHVYACTWWENAVSYVRTYIRLCMCACLCMFNSPLEFDAFYIFIPTDFLHTSIHTFSSYCMFFILFVYRLIADVCFVRGCCCCCFCQLFNGRICCRFWTFFCWFTRSFKLTLPAWTSSYPQLIILCFSSHLLLKGGNKVTFATNKYCCRHSTLCWHCKQRCHIIRRFEINADVVSPREINLQR